MNWGVCAACSIAAACCLSFSVYYLISSHNRTVLQRRARAKDRELRQLLRKAEAECVYVLAPQLAKVRGLLSCGLDMPDLSQLEKRLIVLDEKFVQLLESLDAVRPADVMNDSELKDDCTKTMVVSALERAKAKKKHLTKRVLGHLAEIDRLTTLAASSSSEEHSQCSTSPHFRDRKDSSVNLKEPPML